LKPFTENRGQTAADGDLVLLTGFLQPIGSCQRPIR